jgi:hypothetical protein
MSTGDPPARPARVPTDPGGLPAAKSARTASNPGSIPTTGPRSSTSGSFKALSAARDKPLAPEPVSRGDMRARLKDEAENTALNALALLREAYEDFKRSDQYFKYKALIIAVWLALSGTGIVVSCMGAPTAQQRPSNSLKARLVTTEVAGQAVYSIFNDSGEIWTGVIVRVNDDFGAKVQMLAPGKNYVLGPKSLFSKQLTDRNGLPAPTEIKVSDIVVETDDGNVVLMKNGLPQ